MKTRIYVAGDQHCVNGCDSRGPANDATGERHACSCRVTERVPTSEIQPGDLVLTHGMRVRVSAPRTYTDRDVTVYAFPGKVENLADVLAGGFILRSFLSESRWINGEGWRTELTGAWTIQGNDLARWVVERGAGPCPCNDRDECERDCWDDENECDGHESLNGADMGRTVYCDRTCR